MCNDEVESRLETETVNVLRRQASFFKQKSAVIGSAIAGVLMIPILVCLVCGESKHTHNQCTNSGFQQSVAFRIADQHKQNPYKNHTGNIKWLILICCIIAGIVLLVSGMNRKPENQ